MGTSSLSAIRYLLNVDCKPTATDLPSVEAGELHRYDRPQPSMDAYEQLRPNWAALPQAVSSLPIADWPAATEVIL
jgi:hypothetical protein